MDFFTLYVCKFVGMRKSINLYTGIFSWSVASILTQLDEAEGNEVIMRINSPGGDVFAGYGIASKMREMDANVVAKVDGIAASMAAWLLLFADEVEMSDFGRVMIHRADMYVTDEEQQNFLNEVNNDMKRALKARIDNKKLKELKGVTIEQIFNPDKRIDVWLNAKEAKAIGLVDKVVKLKPAVRAELTDYSTQVAAFGYAIPEDAPETIEDITVEATSANTPKQNKKTMTVEQLKNDHPDAYKAVSQAAAAIERDRVNAWLRFVDVDAEAVKKGIESGEPIGQAAMADFMAKIATATATANLAAEGAATAGAVSQDEPVQTPELTAAEKELKEFEAQVKAHLPGAESK